MAGWSRNCPRKARKTVAFDVLFGELRPDHPPVQMADGSLMESDDFFALQMRRAGNVILAVTPELRPPDLFATNALALGDISTDKDSDGMLRRVKAFHDLSPLASALRKSAAAGIRRSIWTTRSFAPGKIILPQTGTTNFIAIPVDAENNFELADFVGDKLPPGVAPQGQGLHRRTRLAHGHRPRRAGIEARSGQRRQWICRAEKLFCAARTASSA